MTTDAVIKPAVPGAARSVKKCAAILGLLLLFGASNAGANLYYDYDHINAWMSSASKNRYGTFNIAVQGYDRNVESIDWAGFAFTFVDTDNREDTVRITLGHSAVSYEHIEYGFNIFGGLLTGDALLDLSVDGIISYHVRWVSGDPFKLLGAALLAETTPNSVTPPSDGRVPDGGTTLGMLGLAMLAVGFARTKLKTSRGE